MHERAKRRRKLFSSFGKGDGWFSDLAKIALIGAIYFVSGKFGLKLAFLHQSASPVWPPTGIAIAAVLLLGNGIWPGIWFGAFLVNITTAGSVATAMTIAGGNAMEAVCAASLVRWFAGGSQAFDRAGDVFKFALLAAALSTTISATVGVTTLALGGLAPWNQYHVIWLTWWLGDAVSALVLTPLIMIWSARPIPRWDRQQRGEFLLILTVVLAIGLLTFGGPLGSPSSRYPQFLLYPVVLWGAYRFEQRGAISTAFVITCLGIWGTLHGLGRFVTGNPNESLLLLQGYISALTVTNLVLGAVVSERRNVEEALRGKEEQMRSDLEDMAELEQCSEQLVKHGQAQPMLERIVETAIAITGADRGNLQLLDTGSGTLGIAAQRGFQKPFLDFFAGTHAGRAACGVAMQRGERVVVEDVLQSELFAGTPALQILVDADVRAVQSTPLFSRSGELLGILSTHFCQPHRPGPRQIQLLDLLARQAADFIDRCRSETALRDMESQLKLITDITPVMLTRCSRDRRYIFVNRAYAQMLGRRPEQIAGQPIREVIGDTAYQKISPHVKAVLEGRPVEYEAEIAFDGVGPRFLRVCYMPESNAQGDIIGWVASLADLTERKQAEANALLEKQFSDTIVNSLPGIFYLFDQTGRFLRWNRNLEVISGYTREEIARMHPLDFFEESDRDFIRERIRAVFVTGQSDAEGSLVSKAGRKTPYYFTGTRLTIGNTPCLAGLGVDITARTVAEGHLRMMLAISRIIAESPTVSDAMSKFLEVIGESLHCAVGRVWIGDADTSHLQCQQVWRATAPAGKCASVTRERMPASGAGLPGRVWTSRKSAWICDVPKGEYFPLAPMSVAEDLRTAFAFPILSGGRPLAVMEFFSHEIHEPDDALLAMLVGIGIQIGQFMERKEVELTQEHLAAVVRSSGDAIISKSLTGVVTSWNRAAEEMFGYAAAEIIGQSIRQIIPAGEDEEEEVPGQSSNGQSMERLERVCVAKGGRRIPVSVTTSPVKDADGKIIGESITVRDITKHKQAEEALRMSQARYAQLIDSAMDAIVTLDSQQRIVLFNPAAERMFGCPAGEALGKSIDRFIPERFREAHRRQVDEFGGRGVTSRRMGALGALGALRANGEEFPIEASISHMEVGGQKLFTVILRDITERKQTEAALEAWRRELEVRVQQRTVELTIAHKQLRAEIDERQRLEAEMAGAVEREQLRLGHELHDGLGQQLVGMCYMMTALCTKLERAPSSVAPEAHRLEAMLLQSVDQTRNLAKGFYPVELERGGLTPALQEMIHSSERVFGVPCSLESDDPVSMGYKGPVAVQLFRIGQEAVHNAMKHARAKQILVHLSTVGDSLVLRVRDDGIGLPPEVGQSQGMGLRIMRYRAHLIGGELEVRNGTGGGVTVTCRVPCVQLKSQAQSPGAEPPHPADVAA
ncbi:MAG TPA: PAS domain S-box protein [Verrucomicrobiae bacterium]|nr:PAS domain S-box protein [Verrucomicrobiae bacterium]